MNLGSPLDALSNALYHAAWVGLPPHTYRVRDYAVMSEWSMAQRKAAAMNNEYPIKEVEGRPAPSDCEIFAMFSQTWASTALGFGGIGGAAMTPAYTVVVRGPDSSAAVYWNGRFAYRIPVTVTPEQRQAFEEDLAARNTVNCREAVSRYGAQLKADSPR